MSFEELGCSLLMALQPWCFWESEFEFCTRTSKSLSVGEFDENAKCHIFLS
jgi:hypothetical protein